MLKECYLLGNNICGGVSCHCHVWTLANITTGPWHNVRDTCSSVRSTLVVMLVYICALLMTPIHYSSHARCPCNVTLWFLGIYVSALVWLCCGSHPWPTPWAMLSRIGCHGTFHVTSNLLSSIQWLNCRWYIMKKEKMAPLTRNMPRAQRWCLMRETTELDLTSRPRSVIRSDSCLQPFCYARVKAQQIEIVTRWITEWK